MKSYEKYHNPKKVKCHRCNNEHLLTERRVEIFTRETSSGVYTACPVCGYHSFNVLVKTKKP